MACMTRKEAHVMLHAAYSTALDSRRVGVLQCVCCRLSCWDRYCFAAWAQPCRCCCSACLLTLLGSFVYDFLTPLTCFTT